jgi:hypothetical protein
MKRGLIVSLVVASCLGGVMAPAGATSPERVEDIRWDGTVTERDEFLSAECGFDVFATSRGHFRGTVYFNREGEIKRFVGHPSLTNVLSSASATIETADRGVDKITAANADGSLLTVHGTGIHFRVKGEAYAIGLWRITFDAATGENISAEYHGNFGLEEPDIVPFICGRLAPPA